jgi:hypothetical protein
MAEVTQNNNPRFNVIGKLRHQLYNVTGGTGNTLTTGLNSIIQVNVQTVGTNPPTTVANSGGVVTFTSGGTFTAMNVEVIGN